MQITWIFQQGSRRSKQHLSQDDDGVDGEEENGL